MTKFKHHSTRESARRGSVVVSSLTFSFSSHFSKITLVSWNITQNPESLSWYLWSCCRKLENTDKFFGLEHWKTHIPQVHLPYYQSVGESSLQTAQCSPYIFHFSMVSRSNLRHILDLIAEIRPWRLPSDLISHHIHNDCFLNIIISQELKLSGSYPAGHTYYVLLYGRETEVQLEFPFYFGSAFPFFHFVPWYLHHSSFPGTPPNSINTDALK